MVAPAPWDVLKQHLVKSKLIVTQQRKVILEAFLNSNSHVSVDELFPTVRKIDPKIGHTTVFRTLKILCDCGIAQSIVLNGKVTRFEPVLGHAHHDHLLCTSCGKLIEASDPEIEKLQEKLCKKFGFIPHKHKLEITGTCKSCSQSAKIKRKK